MKVTLKQVPHIGNKIAIDLNRSGVVTMTKGLEAVAAEAELVVIDDIKREMALEEKVHDMLEENEEEIEFMLADERQLFFMIKKKLAPEFDVIMSYEERYSNVAHKVLDNLYEEDLIHFEVTENRIKNIIYDAITGFVADNGEIQDAVYDKLKSFTRKLIPGTDEYEILYEKFYQEELNKRGMN